MSEYQDASEKVNKFKLKKYYDENFFFDTSIGHKVNIVQSMENLIKFHAFTFASFN